MRGHADADRLQAPELVISAGCYDGTHIWDGFIDPRSSRGDGSDAVWLERTLFDPAFSRPRDRGFMERNNPTRLISRARGRRLKLPRSIDYHVESAAFDGLKGNVDRARHLVGTVERAGMVNSFRNVERAASAVHSWEYVDPHLLRPFPRHDAAFHQDPG